MSKKKKQSYGVHSRSRSSSSRSLHAEEVQATVQDRLSGEVLEKLKLQAKEWKKEEEERKVQERLRKEEERKAEQKRLENDFAYLLENDKADWRQFK